MVGLKERKERPEDWPMHLDRKVSGFYWAGNDARPPDGFANFADAEAELAPDEVILGFLDRHPYTAPAGSFPARRVGQKQIYDLEGNVHEWVSDDYNGETAWTTARGASWQSHTEDDLTMSMRWTQAKSASSLSSKEFVTYGFRVVLAKVPVKVDKEEPEGANPTPKPKK
jgi:formylglycine-generating enzyme required for sulfatase activity